MIRGRSVLEVGGKENVVQLNPVITDPPITEVILKSLERIFFIFYIGNNRNPPITDKNSWCFEIR